MSWVLRTDHGVSLGWAPTPTAGRSLANGRVTTTKLLLPEKEDRRRCCCVVLHLFSFSLGHPGGILLLFQHEQLVTYYFIFLSNLLAFDSLSAAGTIAIIPFHWLVIRIKRGERQTERKNKKDQRAAGAEPDGQRQYWPACPALMTVENWSQGRNRALLPSFFSLLTRVCPVDWLLMYYLISFVPIQFL